MKNKNQKSEKDLMTRSLFMSDMERIIREATNMPIHNDMDDIIRENTNITSIQRNSTEGSNP